MVTFAQRAGDVHNLELSVSNHTEHSPGDGIGFILTRPKVQQVYLRTVTITFTVTVIIQFYLNLSLCLLIYYKIIKLFISFIYFTF